MEMNVFKDYAKFYNSIYEDKNYQQECEFVNRIFETYSENQISSILDIGCGTGSHDLIFADKYAMTGVDLSEAMLEIARKRASDQKKNIMFIQQDIRYLNIPRKFDAAVAMFAVMGYQVKNKDFENALKSIHSHLNVGGIFVFDVWFGPAVLIQKPADRVKIIEHSDKKIIRYARPVLDIINSLVEVNYTILEITKNKVLTETNESHLMRFFFYQELLYFLEKSNFMVLKICPFLELNGKVDEAHWNISIICRKVPK